MACLGCVLAAGQGNCYVTGVLTDERLAARAELQMITATLGDAALYREYVAIWEPLLKRAGRVNIQASRVGQVAVVKYDSPDKLGVRSFKFDDEVLPGNAVENARRLAEAVEESGLRVVGAFAVQAGSGPATGISGAIYYLTSSNDMPDREIRLRYLKFPDPDIKIRGKLLEKAGVRVALRQGSGAIFYVGKRLGIYALKSDSPEKAAAQQSYYRDIIGRSKEVLIGVETDTLDGRGGVTTYITKLFTYR